MKYSVLGESKTACMQAGAANIKYMPLLKQTVCDLTPEQASTLSHMGYIVKPIKQVRAAVVAAPVAVITGAQVAAVIPGDAFQPLRDYFSPSLNGEGVTVVVIDSGVSSSHRDLRNKVILQENFTSGPPGDLYDHGTGVAGTIATIAPGVSIIDFKVLDSKGAGTEEEVIEAIERVCELVEDALAKNLAFTDVNYPNAINLSLGSEDDGDYDNCLRAAARVAIEEYGIEIVASGGNGGPTLTTITNPACDSLVVAAGGMESLSIEVWNYSSRGPTVLGNTKPDFVMWATDVGVPTAKSDTEYVVKSGTSFAAPCLTGARALLDDLARRINGPSYKFTLMGSLVPVAPLFCTKEEDAPLQKDNSWGYGYPMFGRVASSLTAAPTAGIDVNSIVSMGMVMVIMKAMMGVMV